MSEKTELAIEPRDTKDIPDYHPDEHAEALISKIRKRYEDGKRHRKLYEKTWFKNHCFVMGQHYVVWNDLRHTFTNISAPPGRVRYTVNQILSYWRSTKSKLTAHKPVVTVGPATTDEADVERSRLATFVLDGEFERLNFQALLKDVVGQALESECYVSARWNPWAGEELSEEVPATDPATGAPQMDEMGQMVMQRVPLTDEHGRVLRQGQLEYEPFSPYEFDHDPHAIRMEDAEWINISRIRTCSWIRENYPEKGQFVKPEEVYAHDHYHRRSKQLVGVNGFEADDTQEREDDSAIVHEYWEKPSARHPQGRLVVIAGNVDLHIGPNPYTDMLKIGLPYPVVQFVEVRVPGRFRGMTMIEHGCEINKNLNRARSREIENRTLVGAGKWLVPKGSNLKQGALTAEAGEKVEFTPVMGLKPEMVQPPSTAAATQVEIQHSIVDFQEVMSRHEVSKGVLPSANIPAEGIAKLQAADDMALGETEGEIIDGVQKLGRMTLAICGQFWTEDRLVRVTGEDGRVGSQIVRGDQLHGEASLASYYDVRMMPGSSMWRDSDAQLNQVEKLIGLQLIDPVANREQALKMIDKPTLGELVKDDKIDSSYACLENQMMEAGAMPVPRDFENHIIHKREHDRFRKSERYRRLAPEHQAMIDQHVKAHEAWMVALVQKAAAAEAMAGQPTRDAERAEARQDMADATAANPPPSQSDAE